MTTLGPYQLNAIVTGDARELAEAIPDSSVDLIFTDPVYQNIEDYEWLARTAARVLKPDKACLVWQQVGLIPQTCNAMEALTYRWCLVHYKPGRVKEKFGAAGFSKWEPLLWFDKGRLPRRRWVDVFQSMPFQSELPASINHEWSKDPDAIAKVLMAFIKTGDLVADFFTGGGTVPAVAKMLGVNYWACEIDPETAEKARRRVELTQAPLFVMQPEQAALFAEAAL